MLETSRPNDLGDIANLGLTLPEAKQLLARVQQTVVAGQAGLAFASAPQVRMIGALAWTAADVEFVHLDRAVERMLMGYQQPQSMPHSPGCRLADTAASAKRTEEMRLSDWRMSHKPVSQTRSGSLVECSGVRVVTVT